MKSISLITAVALLSLISVLVSCAPVRRGAAMGGSIGSGAGRVVGKGGGAVVGGAVGIVKGVGAATKSAVSGH